MSDSSLTFRAAAGIILRRGTGEILLCERADKPGCWSLPQGGLEPNESPIMAAYREMGEELGITKEWAQDNILNLPPVVAAFPSLLSYVIPPLYKKADKVGIGQTIQWYVFAWPYTEDPPKLGAEFSHMNWFKTSQVYSLKVTPFKVQMYRELMRWLQEVWV